MFHVEHIILWWGVGIIHYLPHRHTFILYNISHPLPDLRLYPHPRNIFGTSSLPLSLHQSFYNF